MRGRRLLFLIPCSSPHSRCPHTNTHISNPRTRLLSSCMHTTPPYQRVWQDWRVFLLGWRIPAWMESSPLHPVDPLETSQQKRRVRQNCRPAQGWPPQTLVKSPIHLFQLEQFPNSHSVIVSKIKLRGQWLLRYLCGMLEQVGSVKVKNWLEAFSEIS